VHDWPPELLFQLGVGVHLVAGDPDVDHATECQVCGYDAVIRFPIYAIAPSGVRRMPDLDWFGCVRCWDQNNPEE
jgi:hypothetical protein